MNTRNIACIIFAIVAIFLAVQGIRKTLQHNQTSCTLHDHTDHNHAEHIEHDHAAHDHDTEHEREHHTEHEHESTH